MNLNYDVRETFKEVLGAATPEHFHTLKFRQHK